MMGVVNVTPDSFSDGGRYLSAESAVGRVREIVAEGADLVDIGAESTRPGATPIPDETEWARLAPILEAVGRSLSVPISVDSRHPTVARRALDAGADLVNDVGGLRDPEMRQLLFETAAPVVLMHMRGTPESMQRETGYGDVVAEVASSLNRSATTAVAEGIAREKILVDPGLGFGKTAEQNLELIRRLPELSALGFPVVIGASRKSFLGALTEGAAPDDRLEASLAAAVLASERGAEIVRAHDVRSTRRALAVADALRIEGSDSAVGPR